MSGWAGRLRRAEKPEPAASTLEWQRLRNLRGPAGVLLVCRPRWAVFTPGEAGTREREVALRLSLLAAGLVPFPPGNTGRTVESLRGGAGKIPKI